MPHVKLGAALELSRFHQAFAPRVLREEPLVLKAEECYLSSHGRLLLVECVSVEGHLRQGFFVVAFSADGETVVRLSPRTHPEKTDGVLRCVAWIAGWLHAFQPEAESRTTNISTRLARPFPPESTAR